MFCRMFDNTNRSYCDWFPREAREPAQEATKAQNALCCIQWIGKQVERQFRLRCVDPAARARLSHLDGWKDDID